MSGQSGQQVSVREELNNALTERTKQFILEKLDEATLREFLAEAAAAELKRSIDCYDLRREIEQAVRQRVNLEIPKVVEELLDEKEFRSALVASVKKAVIDGIAEASERLKSALSHVLQGR